MYYTIFENVLYTSISKESLKNYGDVYSLPSDYEIGKYIVKDNKLILNENWEQEQAEKERERIAKLHLTRGDVFRGLLQAKGITKAQIRAMIETMPEKQPQEKIAKEMALIDFDDALEFYRGNALIDTLGTQLGITTTQLDKFFEAATVEETKTDAYKYLTNVTFAVNTIPEETTVTINETEGKSLTIPYGSDVEYSVTAEGYLPQSGAIEHLTEDKAIIVELEQAQTDDDDDADADADADTEVDAEPEVTDEDTAD